MKIRTLFLGLVLVVLLLVGAACAPVASTGEESGGPCGAMDITAVDGQYDLDGCTLRIAVENAYQPFNFIDPDTGKAVGYDYDIFDAVCQDLNCKPEFIEISWDAMVAVMGGEGNFETFDVGADGITITDERAAHVAFSDPYISSQQVLLVLIDETRFTEPEEFVADPNLIIGTQLGSTNYIAAEEMVGAERVIAFDQFGTAVQALINGDVDAVMIDNVSGIGYVSVNADKVKITGGPVKSEELGFIFGSDSQLTAPVNQALADLRESGQLDEMYAKWFETESE